MFDSLSDRIRQDEQQESNTTERVMRWVGMLVLSVLLFGGLYLGIKLLE